MAPTGVAGEQQGTLGYGVTGVVCVSCVLLRICSLAAVLRVWTSLPLGKGRLGGWE